jgi:hypothetical protein
LDSAGSVIVGEDPQSLTAATKVDLFSIGVAENLKIEGKTLPLPQNLSTMNTWIIYSLMGAGLLLMVAAMILLFRLIRMKDSELRNNGKMELKRQSLKIIMPLKVQAYERFLLYLERVQLPQLVKRVYVPGMEKGTFHLQLLQNVREEFEHNLAQQLYVAGTTWSAVMNAKEGLVNQINETFEQLKDEEDVSIIAQTLVALPNPMVDQAVAVLKRDFERLL